MNHKGHEEIIQSTQREGLSELCVCSVNFVVKVLSDAPINMFKDH
jgi:hypothetical protein